MVLRIARYVCALSSSDSLSIAIATGMKAAIAAFAWIHGSGLARLPACMFSCALIAIKTANCQPAASNDVPKNTRFENRRGFAQSTVAPTIRLNSAVRIVTVLMRFDFFCDRSRGSGPSRQSWRTWWAWFRRDRSRRGGGRRRVDRCTGSCDRRWGLWRRGG